MVHDFFITILEPILGFIVGGGLVSLIKWRSIKKEAEAQAMRAVQEVYQEAIKDLREDKEMMKRDNAELRTNVRELQKVVFQNSKDISLLKGQKCVVPDCALRKKE